jgi:hypothetical protein
VLLRKAEETDRQRLRQSGNTAFDRNAARDAPNAAKQARPGPAALNWPIGSVLATIGLTRQPAGKPCSLAQRRLPASAAPAAT